MIWGNPDMLTLRLYYILDRSNGVIRVERGEGTVYLNPTEKPLEGVREGINIDEHTAFWQILEMESLVRTTDDPTGDVCSHARSYSVHIPSESVRFVLA